MRRPIGRTTGPIHTYFSLAAPCPALTLVADAQRDHVTRLAPDLPDLPLLSVARELPRRGLGAGPRNYIDVPAGPLAFRTATELYPYPNSLVVLEMSGERWWPTGSSAPRPCSTMSRARLAGALRSYMRASPATCST